MGDLTILDYILYTLLPFGQIFARILNYNGSLDMWWMLLIPFFHMPIIGIIPLLLMKMLNLKDGNIKNSVFDKFLLLPIIIKWYSPFIIPLLLDIRHNSLEYIITTFVIQVLIGTMANISRRNIMCSGDLTVNALGKAFMDATVSHNMGELFVFIFTQLSFFDTLCDNENGKTIINSIFWSIGFGITYLINNMYNEYDPARYCSVQFFGQGQDMFLFMGSILILILTKYNSHISNNNYTITGIF